VTALPSVAPTVVVGGGVSGLALALALSRASVPVTVLEAGAHPGGAARTEERQGFLLEMGPNSLLDREGIVAALATSLGLTLRTASATAKRRFVVREGRLRALPLSPASFLTSDVLPLAAKLRLLLEPFSRRGAEGVDESLGDFARRHLGRATTAALVDALQTGIWAGDMERLSAASAFPRLVALERAHGSLLLGAARSRRALGGTAAPRLSSLEGGLGTLSLAMARELGPRLRLQTQVTGLSRMADGWRLTTATQGLSASRVVLALPPQEAAELVRPFDDGLAVGLAGFPSVPVAVVHLGYRPALEPAPEGFGFLVPSAERRDILGTVYASSAFPFRVPGGGTLLTVLLGGAHRPELLERDDASLVRLARAELSALLGVERTPTLTEVFRWPRAIPQYNVGHAQRVKTALARAATWPGLWLTGNAYGGAGVADCLRTAAALAERLVAG
jgi:protoporphyrinogen/coproporphyrinogen III oxidase